MHTLVEALRFIGRDGVNQAGDPTLIHLTLKHLELSGAALAVALLVAVPLGVWLGHLRRGSFIAFNVSYVGRALPSLAVIAIGIPFLGLGFRNVVVALIVLAIPPILTNAYVGVAGVESEVVDAARGMGMREREILLRVELPLALPILFAGIRISAVFVVATATITALAGYSGSLGDIIANQASYRFSGVLGAAICVAALALAVDGAFALAQRLVTPRGLRVRQREGGLEAAPGRLEPLPEVS
ncbi:MAG: ABC transporter permease [Solirubrobacteraceae bacterium]